MERWSCVARVHPLMQKMVPPQLAALQSWSLSATISVSVKLLSLFTYSLYKQGVQGTAKEIIRGVVR